MSTRLANLSLFFPLASGKAVEMDSRQEALQGRIAELTRRLASGDEPAFREFHQRYFHRLYQFLLVVERGQELEAQEALQLTLLRVVRYARVFDSEEAFWSWLQVLARSSARDAGRGRRRYSALLEKFGRRLELQQTEQPHNEDSSLRAALEESLLELEPGDRRLVESKYLEGATMQELSAQHGVTARAVESRLFRLRRRLREQVLKKLRSS